jgi:hypothetical protein
MNEILPGVFHWTSVHERHKIVISSYLLPGRGVLIDPSLPEGGVEAVAAKGTPGDILLTNRHHYRHSAKYVERFGCTVWCHEAGLHEFTRGEAVKPYRPGDTLPGGIVALEVGAICPDDTALFIPEAEGVVAFADGLVRHGGALSFVPDVFMGDDPEAVKSGLKTSFRNILELDFDHLLLAHGGPWIGGAKEALRRFVEQA